LIEGPGGGESRPFVIWVRFRVSAAPREPGSRPGRARAPPYLSR
jgi:hypothetical protein